MTTQPQSFAESIGRIEALVQQIEQSPDAKSRETTRQIVRKLLELHRMGLSKIVDLLSRQGGDPPLLDTCLQDDLVRSLLLLHDLHPESLEHRVRQALESVRPYLQSHGGNVELLEVSPAGIRLRMEGSCHGCPSSAATLRDTIERAICQFAPDAGAIDVEGLDSDSPPARLVALELPQADTGMASHDDRLSKNQLAAHEN